MIQELIAELTEIMEGAKALKVENEAVKAENEAVKAENEELKANAVDPAEVEALKSQIEEIKVVLFGKPVEPVE